MILVLLGTQNNSFHRLLEELENCIENKVIQDKVVVQCGHTKFESECMEIVDFLSADEFNKIIKKADLIITHGGVGSVINSLKAGKKVIAVARLSKFKEHVNDHQVQLIETFDRNGYIKGISDIKKLSKTIITIKEFEPKPYISNNTKMIEIISNYIDNN